MAKKPTAKKQVRVNNRSLARSANQAKTALDSWENTLTGLGVKNQDKRLGAVPFYDLLSEQEMEIIYAADDIAKRITDRLPYDMTRKWFEITGSDVTPEMSSDVISYLDKFDIRKKIRRGLSWGRQYGGAGLIVGVTGFAGNSAEPLNPNEIRSIEFLTLMTRYELVSQSPIDGDVTSKNYGLPTRYMLSPRNISGDSNGIMVHWSRIIRFEGDELPLRIFAENNYWHSSVYSRLLNAIRNYQSSHDSLALLIQDFAQAVYKIKDLGDIVASKDGADLIQRRINIIDLCRSVLNAVLIGEDEDFDRKTTTLTGVADVFKIINNRLVAATDMPHTILLGESPSGLGASGESEESTWYDYVSGQQEEHLRPILERLLKLVFLAKDGPTGGREPANWEIKFHPLDVPSDKDLVDIRNKQADTDKKYIEAGVVTPDEVAESRFGGDEYSIETKLSMPRDPTADPSMTGLEEEETEETEPTEDE